MIRSETSSLKYRKVFTDWNIQMTVAWHRGGQIIHSKKSMTNHFNLLTWEYGFEFLSNERMQVPTIEWWNLSSCKLVHTVHSDIYRHLGGNVWENQRGQNISRYNVYFMSTVGNQSMSIGCVGKLGHLFGFLRHYLLKVIFQITELHGFIPNFN